jgi:hypothetical protein
MWDRQSNEYRLRRIRVSMGQREYAVSVSGNVPPRPIKGWIYPVGGGLPGRRLAIFILHSPKDVKLTGGEADLLHNTVGLNVASSRGEMVSSPCKYRLGQKEENEEREGKEKRGEFFTIEARECASGLRNDRDNC